MNEQDRLIQEGLFVSKRLFQLQEKPIKGKYDLSHLCKINEYLFQDLPKLGGDYAKIYKPGQYRPALLPWKMWMKHRPLLNCSDVSTIVYSNMDEAIIKETNAYLLKNTDITKLKRMRINNFVNKISELYTKLDYLHPFYDGNSRTIREFTRTLALEAGFNMNWQNTNINIQSRNELYIARDTAVNQIAYERCTIPEGKYDIEMYMKPFKGKKTLTEILSDNVERIKVKKKKTDLGYKTGH